MTTKYASLVLTLALIPVTAFSETDILEAKKPASGSVGNGTKSSQLAQDAKANQADKLEQKPKEGLSLRESASDSGRNEAKREDGVATESPKKDVKDQEWKKAKKEPEPQDK